MLPQFHDQATWIPLSAANSCRFEVPMFGMGTQAARPVEGELLYKSREPMPNPLVLSYTSLGHPGAAAGAPAPLRPLGPSDSEAAATATDAVDRALGRSELLEPMALPSSRASSSSMVFRPFEGAGAVQREVYMPASA